MEGSGEDGWIRTPFHTYRKLGATATALVINDAFPMDGIWDVNGDHSRPNVPLLDTLPLLIPFGQNE